jgi:hypothetical protein
VCPPLFVLDKGCYVGEARPSYSVIRKPPLEEKMFYFQDVLRLPARCFISQKDVLSFQNIFSFTCNFLMNCLVTAF